MSDPQQIEKDLKDYLEKEPNLRREDRFNFLKAIFDKHFEIHKMEHVINAGDLFEMLSSAKGGYANHRAPMFISRKRIESSESVHVSVIESFITYLNKNKLLRKFIKFDYTE